MKKAFITLLMLGSVAFGQWLNVTSHSFYSIPSTPLPACPGTGTNGAQYLLTSSIRDLYTGKDTNTQWKIQSLSSGFPVYNTNHWAVSLDWSGVSMMTTSSVVVLITDKHAISSFHILGLGIPGNTGITNAELYFYKEGVGVHTNRITNGIQILDSDICLLTLSNTVPSDYKPVKVFNKNMTNYLPYGITSYCGTNEQFDIIWRRNYDSCLHVKAAAGSDLSYVTIYAPINTTDGFYVPPTDFCNTNVVGVGGDSGSPIFAVVGTNLVLISTLINPSRGPFISYKDYYDELTNKIAVLGKTLDEYTFPVGTDTYY